MTEPLPALATPPSTRETGRLEAFSDGVLAVIITLMALQLRVPDRGDFSSLRASLPSVLIYLLSFAFIGIYWNNHHHLLRAATRVNGAVMWTNLHLLFWLSLTPFVTEWVGNSYRSTAPAATYSLVAFAAGLAYTLLAAAIVRSEGRDSAIAKAIGVDVKGLLSMVAYAMSFGFAFLSPWISYAVLVGVALGWFVPDRRLAR